MQKRNRGERLIVLQHSRVHLDLIYLFLSFLEWQVYLMKTLKSFHSRVTTSLNGR